MPVIRLLTSHAMLTEHWLMIWTADVHNVMFQLYLLIIGVGYWLLVSGFHCVPWTWLLTVCWYSMCYLYLSCLSLCFVFCLHFKLRMLMVIIYFYYTELDLGILIGRLSVLICKYWIINKMKITVSFGKAITFRSTKEKIIPSASTHDVKRL